MAFGSPDGARLRAGFLSNDELDDNMPSRWSGGPSNYLLGLNIPRLAQSRFAYQGSARPRPMQFARNDTALGFGVQPMSAAQSPQLPHVCKACHGTFLPPLPPPGFPPSMRQGSGGGGSTGSPSGPRENPKQCHVQYERDSRTCGRLKDWIARENCRANASDRMAYCIRTKGEVGWPPLLPR